MVLELSSENPYAETGYIQLNKDQTMSLERERLRYVPSRNDRVHTVKAGEMLDGIAFQYYKGVANGERYYWLIGDANDSILNPLDLSDLVGSDIIIPDLNFNLLNL